jgi:hypothetical protein
MYQTISAAVAETAAAKVVIRTNAVAAVSVTVSNNRFFLWVFEGSEVA